MRAPVGAHCAAQSVDKHLVRDRDLIFACCACRLVLLEGLGCERGFFRIQTLPGMATAMVAPVTRARMLGVGATWAFLGRCVLYEILLAKNDGSPPPQWLASRSGFQVVRVALS